VGKRDLPEPKLNQLNLDILKRIVARCRVYLSNATLHSKFCLRACIVKHRTTVSDVDAKTMVSGVYQNGIEYLGYWLRKAQDAWSIANGVPLDKVYLPSENGQPCTNDVYEQIMRDVMRRLRMRDINDLETARSGDEQIPKLQGGCTRVVQRDPRDLLRGDYVVLQYAIDQISVDIIAGGRPEYGERLWVLLEPKDGLHVVVAASRAPVTPSPEQRLIVGEVRSFVAVAAGGARTSGVHVDYGIQRYYVPEGRGILPRGKVEAEVALPSSGRALLTRLFVDGRPYP